MKIIRIIIILIMGIFTLTALSQSSFPPKKYPASIMVITDPGVAQYWDVKRIMYTGPANGGHKFRIYGQGAEDHGTMNITMYYILPGNKLQSAGAYFFPAVKKGEPFNFEIVSAFTGYAPKSFLGFMIMDEMLQVRQPQIHTTEKEDEIRITSSTPGQPVDDDSDEIRASKIFTEEEVDVMASFPGGNEALIKWLINNIRYPEEAAKKNIQGKVVIKFLVRKDGTIGPCEIIQSVDTYLDKEAIRLVKKMPRWSPGISKGEPVVSYFNLPINFRLTEK